MKLLLIEDDPTICDHLARGLASLGHRTAAVGSGEEGLRSLALESFDGVLLDRMLPGIDGIELLRRMATNGPMPSVIMLSALGTVDDRIAGLEAGADDYVVKPYELNELDARLHAVARRRKNDRVDGLLRAGEVEINVLNQRARRGDRVLHLNKKETGLLSELIRHADTVVTRRMLIESVWGYAFDPTTNIVESNMSRLRGKLTLNDERDPIETLRGIGYILNSNP